GHRILEVNAAGKVVWEYAIPTAVGADRLPNGNTLITNGQANEVLEVDRAGKIVLKLLQLRTPVESRRLSNGHTIVIDQGKVHWFDATGKSVRTVSHGLKSGTVHVY